MSTISKYLKLSNYINTVKGIMYKYLIYPLGIPFVKLGFMRHGTIHIHGNKKRLSVGENCALGNTIFNTRGGRVNIADYVIFGHNNMILTGIHNYKDAMENVSKIYEVDEHGYDINIGNCTLIGSGAMILGGVTIGKHCVIGAGAVVTKDIPNYSMVAGVPAKIIKDIRYEK